MRRLEAARGGTTRWAWTRRPAHTTSGWVLVLGVAGFLAYHMAEAPPAEPQPHMSFISHPAPPPAPRYRLCGPGVRSDCVIDGDTIRYGGVKVRVADIDAPEISQPRCASEAALGERAKARLLELLNRGPFTLSRAGGPDEDGYDRKLRVIERDGRSLGQTLVAEGLARRWDGARRSWCG
ncbi:MAG TPA: thermonuclease family protein [Beijerinckiaceae bacterium]